MPFFWVTVLCPGPELNVTQFDIKKGHREFLANLLYVTHYGAYPAFVIDQARK